MPDRSRQTLRLSDGRALGYAEWGSPQGKPLILFVGGSSRLVHPLGASNDIRLITLDRPGLGQSDFQPGRRLLDLPEDVLQLADHLGLNRFAVVGLSQAGPAALACAYKLPQRLVAVSVVSSLAPLSPQELKQTSCGAVAILARLANHFPLALKFQAALGAWLVSLNPAWTFQQVLQSLPAPDRGIFEASPELRAMFVRDLKETYRQGSRGSAQEALLAYRPWGFRPEDICAKVYVWHGEQDQSVPVAMGYRLAKALADCQAHLLADEGHFLGLKYWNEIAAQVVAPA